MATLVTNRVVKGRAANTLRTSVLLGALIFPLPAASQADPGAHSGHLHFSHPLRGESPSPDTKVRLDYLFRDASGEEAATSHTAQLEAEYAFRPWVSLELNIPYTFRNPDDGKATSNLDTVEIGVKLASFAFADHGLLFGGGLELGLPTGNSTEGIGSSHVLEVEPFVDVGFKQGEFELVGFLSPAFPTNENGEDEANVELGWNVSLLYHLNSRVEALLEFDGERVYGGEEADRSTANITPGMKLAPLGNQNLKIGVGVSLPIASDEDFHVRTVLSLFYHFSTSP